MKVFAMLVLSSMVALMLGDITADYLNVKFNDKNGSGKNLFCVS